MATSRPKKPPAQTVDLVSGRLITSGPEEIEATQPLLDLLVNEAGWDIGQIVSRPNQWRVPSNPSGKRIWPVDVAIFSDTKSLRDPDKAIILCECKRPDVATGIEQLKIYLDREPHARIGIWFNGIDHAIVYKTVDGYELAPTGTPIPTPKDPLTPVGKKALTIDDLRQAPSLVPLFKRIRDRLAASDANVNRDEEILPDISLLLLLKILDEQSHRFTTTHPLDFQLDDTPKKTAARIRALLDTQVSRNGQLFGADNRQVRFQLDDDSITFVVQSLQAFRLLSNDVDAVAEAFQVIRGKAYKGEEGQYFTPQSVVRVAISAVDPQPEDRVIDPACGSGSFLATALANVVAKLESVYGSDVSSQTLAKREWSSQQLFAVDKDAVSVRLSKAYLSMLGDGSTHVFKADSMRPSGWPTNLTSIIQDGSFDVVVTNPPFGTRLKVDAQTGRREDYELAREWKRDKSGVWNKTENFVERDLGLIFLERSIRLLRPGGRLAIVLPDTYLFSDKYGWLVQWLAQFTITHSINVPIEAFEPHCRAKTSVLVVEKAPPTAGHQIVGSLCSTFGEDKHGKARFKWILGEVTEIRDDEMAEASRLIRDGATEESKLHFSFSQEEAIAKGVLVASYWWRKPVLDALHTFAEQHDCDLVSIEELMDSGELKVQDGHGSPGSQNVGRGTIPYVKVIDIKNWRVIGNPKYLIPEDIAAKFRKSRPLQSFDIVTPTRASRNIGLFGVILPWQTSWVLTREIGVWRVMKEGRIDPWLLLALMSLTVVHEQFASLIMMQMNREDLSGRFREILLPIPRSKRKREDWSGPIREYFEALVLAHEKYEELESQLDRSLFSDGP